MTNCWRTEYLSVAFVGYNETPAWNYPVWIEVAAELEKITKNCREKFQVRTTQSENEDSLKFGVIPWSVKGHEKWTHLSPVTNSISKGWKFYNLEVWSPPAKACENKERAPDFFFSMENPFIGEKVKKNQFNQFLHLAVPTDFARQYFAELKEIFSQIAAIVKAKEILARKTSWYDENHHSVQDTINNSLNYYGMCDEKIYDFSKSRGEWVLFDQVELE